MVKGLQTYKHSCTYPAKFPSQIQARTCLKRHETFFFFFVRLCIIASLSWNKILDDTKETVTLATLFPAFLCWILLNFVKWTFMTIGSQALTAVNPTLNYKIVWCSFDENMESMRSQAWFHVVLVGEKKYHYCSVSNTQEKAGKRCLRMSDKISLSPYLSLSLPIFCLGSNFRQNNVTVRSEHKQGESLSRFFIALFYRTKTANPTLHHETDCLINR